MSAGSLSELPGAGPNGLEMVILRAQWAPSLREMITRSYQTRSGHTRPWRSELLRMLGEDLAIPDRERRTPTSNALNIGI